MTSAAATKGNVRETQALSVVVPENPAQDPVERLARRLLAEAEACPTLISRSGNSSSETKRRSKGSFSAMALLSDPVPDIRQYLEDLVIGSLSVPHGKPKTCRLRRARLTGTRSGAWWLPSLLEFSA